MSEVANNGNKNRRPLTKEEDALIITLVEKYKHKWSVICKKFNKKNINGERSYNAIRGRWRDHLNPSLTSNLPFSSEEDELLLKKVDETGKHWTLITKFFPNRSINQLKNRYIELNKNKINRNRYKQNEINEIKKLIQANPKKFDTDIAKEFNKNSLFGNRSVDGLSIKISKLRKTLNPKNPTVNQNNSPQQNQNASAQYDNFFQFDNDNLLDQFENFTLGQNKFNYGDDIPELKNYDFDIANFYL